MNIHENARLTPRRREEMALSISAGRLSKAEAARAFGVCAKIAGRWTTRFRAEGGAGMQDRSSRPKVIPTQTAWAAGGAHHHAPPPTAQAGGTLQSWWACLARRSAAS